jgi:hypothetical protein
VECAKLYVCEYLESVVRERFLCILLLFFPFPRLPKKLSYYGSIWVNTAMLARRWAKTGPWVWVRRLARQGMVELLRWKCG